MNYYCNMEQQKRTPTPRTPHSVFSICEIHGLSLLINLCKKKNESFLLVREVTVVCLASIQLLRCFLSHSESSVIHRFTWLSFEINIRPQQIDLGLVYHPHTSRFYTGINISSICLLWASTWWKERTNTRKCKAYPSTRSSCQKINFQRTTHSVPKSCWYTSNLCMLLCHAVCGQY